MWFKKILLLYCYFQSIAYNDLFIFLRTTKLKNKLIEWVLFNSPLSWMAKIGVHFREVQMRYLFADEKPTFLQTIGLEKFTY